MLIHIPSAIATEHKELHAELARLLRLGGKTGAAAHKLDETLAPHFEEENRYALPPLGLLPDLAKHGATEAMRPAIEMSRHVEQNLGRYMAEHRKIVEALGDLERAAKEEGHSQALAFVAELRAHAQQEEQVLYPTTILIGHFLAKELGTR